MTKMLAVLMAVTFLTTPGIALAQSFQSSSASGTQTQSSLCSPSPCTSTSFQSQSGFVSQDGQTTPDETSSTTGGTQSYVIGCVDDGFLEFCF